MTSDQARAFLVEQLTLRYDAGEAASVARIVLEDVFEIRGAGSKLFQEKDIQKLAGISERLKNGEPVQYVVGEADFFGLRFKVNPAVLIPRQETESLVAWVLEYLKSARLEKPAVLDIGLGSGCIGVTIKAKYPSALLFGIEKSPEALEIATENARRILGEGAFEFFLEDVLALSVDGVILSSPGHFDVIVSNPPYIPHAEKQLMPEHVLAHEPALALFVENDDPLVFYRRIAELSRRLLRPGGVLFFECNEFNARQAGDLLRETGFSKVELRKDLAGADRMLRANV
jgi:release factor glutamine methyltransferase